MAGTDWIGLFLEEDVGSGDITTDAIFTPREQGAARIVAREAALLAGIAHAREVFLRRGAHLEAFVSDGEWVEPGQAVARVVGPVRAILTGERVALNLVSRMSGIATQTRGLAEALAAACCGAVVAGTRKTTPGFRRFEKEAIRIGGGDPHRMGLWDAALVKDNHIAAAGSVGDAVAKVRRANPGAVVQCEVESLAAALEAAAAGAHWLLIDNQDPATGKAWAEAVWDTHPEVNVEASGGITPATVADYGWADRVSLGWLTSKAQGRDFGLDWETGQDPPLPAKVAKPAKAGKPTKPAKPAKPATRAKPAKPSKPIRPGKPARPAKRAKARRATGRKRIA